LSLQIIAFFGLSLKLLMAMVNKGFQIKKWEPARTKFRAAHGYSYDLVMVMPIYAADAHLSDFQKKYSHEYVVGQLNRTGMQTSLFYSVQQGESRRFPARPPLSIPLPNPQTSLPPLRYHVKVL
jgi:hypothetical protein